jgi:hypothetical protein
MSVGKQIKSHKSLVIGLFYLSLKKNCIFTPNASKATKIVQFGYEMNKICYFEVKGVIV